MRQDQPPPFAKTLGITLRSLRYRMQKLTMQNDDDDAEPVSSDSPGSA